MKRRVALLAVLPLLTALCGFGSVRPTKTSAHNKTSAHKMTAHKLSAQNQFHFKPTKGRVAQILARGHGGEQKAFPGQVARDSRGKHIVAQTQTKNKVHKHSNPPISQIGFVSATQIPAGGYLTTESIAGYFTTDGNPGVVSLVGDPANPGNFYFSVVESNGNGTFAAPVWTATPGNITDPFAIGDVNGDGMDDIIFVHQPGTNSNPNSSFDVLLSVGDGTFAVENNYSISGTSLSGGTVALNATTGFLDVVVVDSSNPASVWTVAGNGDGTFSATPTSVALSVQVGYDVIVADLNGDGLLDVTENDNSSVIGQQVVFLATSATQFAVGVPYLTPDTIYDACSTTVGDLNGDGFPEIVNANCNDNTITIYMNNGDGTFATGAYYDVAEAPSSTPVYAYPEAVTIADVNGDGLPDIVSTNDDSSDVTILLGNGDGTVQTPTIGYAMGGYPGRPAIVADLNGDGLVDILVPDDDYSLSYMRGYGDGTFRAAVDYYGPNSAGNQPYAWDVATGDFDGDGVADFVAGNWCCDSNMGITVFLSRGDGSLKPGVNYGTGGYMAYVAVGDFNKDGKLDIAASDASANVVQIFTGAGDGTFTNSATINSSDSELTRIVAADFNGDGWTDLAVMNSNSSSFSIILNDGTGAFLAPVDYPTSGAAQDITAADVNGDGKIDLLVPEYNCGCLATFLGVGDGTFGAEADLPLGFNRMQQVAVGDLNGDGKVDLAITIADYSNGMGVLVALGNGDGTFTVGSLYPTTLQSNYYEPYPSFLKMVDLDGDQKLDLIVTNPDYSTVSVMYGAGDGSFFDPVEYPTSGYSAGLALADVNGDGALDVVTVSDDVSAATVLLNNSGTATVPDYTVTSNPMTQTVTAGDTATFTITLSPRNFYNGTVTFSCGTLPTETTCTFSNPTLIPNGNGQLTTTLTLTTTAPGTAAAMAPVGIHPQGGATNLLASLSGVGLFGLMLAGSWNKKSRRQLAIVLTVVALGLMITLVGCGGSSSVVTPPPPPPPDPGTTAGSYVVQVSAAGTAGNNGGNTTAHTLSLSLTVQ